MFLDFSKSYSPICSWNFGVTVATPREDAKTKTDVFNRMKLWTVTRRWTTMDGMGSAGTHFCARYVKVAGSTPLSIDKSG